MSETKVCKICGEEKPITSFKKVHAIYRQNTCNKCIYNANYKSTKLPRTPVKKFTGIEPNKSIYSSGAAGHIKRRGHEVE